MEKSIIIKSKLPNKELLYLHDAELGKIFCDYYSHKIIISLNLNKPNSNKASITFKKVKHFDISFYDLGVKACMLMKFMPKI